MAGQRINIRTKGASGEREVATLMNEIIAQVCQQEGIAVPLKPIIQRNQNQTAVGGSDLTNPFDFAIEVKRQEALSINSWWNQAVAASLNFGGTPVVIFRQNKQKWRVLLYAFVPVWKSTGFVKARAEVSLETFFEQFAETVRFHIRTGRWKPENG